MTTTSISTIETIFNTKDGYHECNHCQSVLSPSAYFVKLMETVEKYIKQPTNGKDLKSRRPDLFTLLLDCNSTKKEKLYLEIANDVMKDNLNLKLGTDALRKLANTNTKIKTQLKSHKLDDLYKDLSLARELGISYEDCKSITSKEDLKTLAGTKYPNISAYLKKHNASYEDLYKKLSLVKKLDISKEDYQLITSDILQKLAAAKYPFNLPANFPLIGIRAYLKEHSLAEMYKILVKSADTTAESLHLSPEAYQIIISRCITEDNLKTVYGVDKSEELAKVDLFTAKTNISYDELDLLLDSYNKIKEPADSAKLTIKDKTIKNLNDDAKDFLHRFIRLAVQLDWSFTELGQILLMIDKNEINADTIKLIAAIKNLQNKLKQPLNKISELCFSSVDFFVTNKVPEEFQDLLKKGYKQFQDIIDSNVNISSTLQDILKIDGNELSTLVNYNDAKDKSNSSGNLRLFRIYKQVSLAKVIGISIAELTQFLSLLNINEPSLDNIEHVVELNDWLKKYSITIQQLNDLLKPPVSFQEQASKIEEEIKEQAEPSELPSQELLYNIISQYVEVQRDLFNAIYEFTKKYKGQEPEKTLLQNIAIFTTLKLSAEDVNNITKHRDAYGMQEEWSLSQIKTLVNYKTLKDIFSSGGIKQYTDWLNGEDYKKDKVVEKIVQLTGWNKDTLEDIKKVKALEPCFAKTQNPIDSLLKIKSLMDLVTKSGINSKVLLSLKDLYNLEVGSDSNKWKKYTDAAENLELSVRSEVKDKAVKYLAEQKRDILARYSVHILKLKDMRELYSFLLIDVEMSDCSKISLLKAALNSVQLFIHRCMMGLEKGVTIDKGLNEEKWKLLSSYREWEASSKIRLYPENYLNPTLQKIISPEYKTLQNTLMQGNITDEAVSNAYIKYFEDFEEVSTLKIVDSYFEEVEDKILGIQRNTLYIIGRTLTQPYNYYYRTAIFDKENKEIVYWTAWEKMEAPIPAETVTPIYAFNRLFIFWYSNLQKKKVKMLIEIYHYLIKLMQQSTISFRNLVAVGQPRMS